MILAVSLFLVSLAALASLWMVRTLLDHQKINTRKRELTRAYNVAEAGVSLVQHWGNDEPKELFYPSNDYTPNQTLFDYVPPPTPVPGVTPSGAGMQYVDGSVAAQFPTLFAALAGGPITINESTLDGVVCSGSDYSQWANKSVAMFKSIDSAGTQIDIGKITEIVVGLPTQYPFDAQKDPAFPVSYTGPAVDIVIKSTGRSPLGVERTVIAFCEINPFIKILLPAALISMGTAATFGNAKIHWGESWSKDNFDMLNESQVGYLDPSNANYDQWAKYRTEAKIKFFGGGWSWDNTSPYNGDVHYDTNNDKYDDFDKNAASGTAANPANQDWDGFLADGVTPNPANPLGGFRPGLFPDGSGTYKNAFWDQVPPGKLYWPDFKNAYEQFKKFAIDNGRYYTTNASNEILNSSGQVINFGAEFGDPQRDELPYDFVFIDTKDQMAPKPDGSNLATIQVQGSLASQGIKGIFYICANFDAGGTGNPPSLGTAEKPDGTAVTSLSKIFLDGVLYAAGTLAMGGNNGVFGSVVAEKGFVGGGTPDIYYNWKLANGLDLSKGNTGSRFKRVLQLSYSYNPLG